jgi:carboxylesterase
LKLQESLQKEIELLQSKFKNGIVEEAAPIEIEGKGHAFLLLHGFTSSPKEFSELAKAIAEKGFGVFVPLLPGHGTNPRDLEKIKKDDWIKSIETIFENLQKRYSQISVIGFSLGGALALHLAEKYVVVQLVLIAPWIIIYKDPSGFFSVEFKIKSIGRFVRYSRKETVGNINDPAGLTRHFAYFHFPLSAVREAIALVKEVKKNIQKVIAPCLLIHSKNDKTIDWHGSDWIYNHIGSKEKKLLWLTKSNHVVMLDYDKETVLQKIMEFIAR